MQRLRLFTLAAAFLFAFTVRAQAPAFVQITPVVNCPATQVCTATFPSNNTAGNTGFVLVTTAQVPGVVQSVKDQLQDAYVSILGPKQIGSPGGGALFQTSFNGGGPNTITVTMQAVASMITIVGVEYSPATVIYYGLPATAGNSNVIAVSGLLAGNNNTLVSMATTNVTGTTVIVPPGPTPARTTPLVAGNFTLGAGWGSTASITAVNGTDQAFSYTVTSTGTGQVINPTVLLTFSDGAFPSVPLYVCNESGGTGTLADMTLSGGSATLTTVPMIWNSTPAAGLTYEFTCTGQPNNSGTATVTTTGGATITAGAGFTLRNGTSGILVQDRYNVSAGTYATGPAYPTISQTAQWESFFFALALPPTSTTTIGGQIRDLSGNPILSGQVVFTLNQGTDTTLSANARFSPAAVTCGISGQGFVQNVTLSGPCLIVMNTTIQPAGTYYNVAIQAENTGPLTGSSFNIYATTSYQDISTFTPTPSQVPIYNLVNTFSNQTIGGNKTFTGIVTFTGGSQLIINGPFSALNGATFNGASFFGTVTMTGSTTITNLNGVPHIFAPSCNDTGLNSALMTIGKGVVDATQCATGTVANTVLIPDGVQLLFGPSTWTVTVPSGPGFWLEGSTAKFNGAGAGDTGEGADPAPTAALGTTNLICSGCGSTTDMIYAGIPVGMRSGGTGGIGNALVQNIDVGGFWINMGNSGRDATNFTSAQFSYFHDMMMFNFPRAGFHLAGALASDNVGSAFPESYFDTTDRIQAQAPASNTTGASCWLDAQFGEIAWSNFHFRCSGNITNGGGLEGLLLQGGTTNGAQSVDNIGISGSYLGNPISGTNTYGIRMEAPGPFQGYCYGSAGCVFGIAISNSLAERLFVTASGGTALGCTVSGARNGNGCGQIQTVASAFGGQFAVGIDTPNMGQSFSYCGGDGNSVHPTCWISGTGAGANATSLRIDQTLSATAPAQNVFGANITPAFNDAGNAMFAPYGLVVAPTLAPGAISGNFISGNPAVLIDGGALPGGGGLQVSDSTTLLAMLEAQGTPAGLTGCSPTSVKGGSWAGTFQSGIGGTCTVTIAPGYAAKNGYVCQATDLTTPADKLAQTAYSNVGCTISGPTASSDIITWTAVAF